MIVLALGLGALALLVSVAVAWWLALNRAWLVRAEQAHLDHEVRRSQRSLHDLTSKAFTSMLQVARHRGKSGHSPWS